MGLNDLSGSIPSQIGSIGRLSKCLSGAEMKCRKTILGTLLMYIPQTFPSTSGELYMQNNNLNGSLPSEIGNLTDLSTYTLIAA